MARKKRTSRNPKYVVANKRRMRRNPEEGIIQTLVLPSLVGAGGLLASQWVNQSLVSQLLEGGPSIELLVELKSDPQTASGVQWSSSVGPPLRITPGTTGLATVIVRRIRPVDLVIPIVKTWIGGS